VLMSNNEEIAETHNNMVEMQEHNKEESHATANTSTKDKILPFVLFFLVGLAPWFTINGVWLQMGNLVQVCSEGPAIAANMALAIQISNFVAFFYVFLQLYKPVSHSVSITFILGACVLNTILLSFFWSTQTELFGQMRSVALITLVFSSGVVACLSVVVFYPFVSLYKPEFTSALSTGMGSSGLIASLIAMVQQPTKQFQAFSVQWFFIICSIILTLSFISFILIRKLPSVMKYQVREQHLQEERKPLLQEGRALTKQNITYFWQLFKQGKVAALNQLYICILSSILMGAINFAVVNYSDSEVLLLWLNALGMIAGTIGRLLSAWIRYYKVTLLSFLQSITWIFLFIMCFYGHHPLTGMGWIIVAASAVNSFLYGYEDTVIYLKVAVESKPDAVEPMSRIVGLSNQVGNFIGSIISFILVTEGVIQ